MTKAPGVVASPTSHGRSLSRQLAERYPVLTTLRPGRLVFGNRLPLRLNVTYWRHWRRCRARAAVATRHNESERHAIDAFRRDGYCILPPAPDGLAVTARVVDDLVRAGKVWTTPGVEEWVLQIAECMDNVPGVLDALRADVVAVLEGIYKCPFKVYSAEVYRIVPTTDPPQLSGLWHTDNYPPGLFKAMVYLTDCDRTTGALRVHRRPASRRLLRRGFSDRYRARPFTADLDRDWLALEAPAGSVVLWDSNLVHRATAPESGYRDAIALKFLPSVDPWRRHAARMGARLSYEAREQYPLDPAAD